MQSERLVVKYITVNNCFVYLPDTWLRKLETKENVIKIEHNGKTYYASCNAGGNSSDTLCFSATFARSLSIPEGDEVFVSSVKDVQPLTQANVVPRTTDDREILEVQMDKVQSTLLNQIRVVAMGQPIVAWVSKFSSVTFIVESLEPSLRYGRLEQFTEVHVGDAIANSSADVSSKDHESSSKIADNLRAVLKRFLPFAVDQNDERTQEDRSARNYELVQSFRNKKKPSVYRVHPMPRIAFDDENVDAIARCPYHVFVPRSQAPRFADDFAICGAKKVPEAKQYANVTSTSFLVNDESPVPKLAEELTVRLFILEDLLERSSSLDRDHFDTDLLHRRAYVSDSLRITLGLRIGGKVSLWQVESPREVAPSSIELFSWRDSVSTERFEGYVRTLTTRHELLINSCSAVVLDDGSRCVVKISPENCTVVAIDEAVLKGLRVHSRSVSERSHLRLPEQLDQEAPRLEKISVRHLENTLMECKLPLDLSLGLRKRLGFKYDRENVLICGDVGSGKTTVCKILVEYLRNAPYFVHTNVVDCRSLKGKKAEMLQKFVTTVLTECVYYQPSVLFLDDLESITNASTNDEENTPDAMNAARIVDMLVNTVTQYQESHCISVVATCAGVNKLGQKLRPARGSNFFRTVLSIPNLDKVHRIDILQLMLGDKLYVPVDVNWDYYGNKTEGWMVQDLVDMAEKAAFAAWKRTGASRPPVLITEEDVSIALKNCTPMSLQGIQLYKGGSHVWSDIGGLADVKKSLVEILQWPLKYPEIFKNAPIKLQNGVLLYGMPGTGKTMLAKAIANECGVNLISVKGPELLSKYIGVSEESVRNVFERAFRAKPCVLFFDEFDSLAPRRGHDSTGVTDRVVNQLLTQMDGVEDREGVAVVAASSRPDLLDPALLRPGRLDKALYCPLPCTTDREAILAALCKTQNVDVVELDLKKLAELTPGFTGADLNAAITQARLSAYEDAVAKASGLQRSCKIERQTPLLAVVSSSDENALRHVGWVLLYSYFQDGKIEAADIRVLREHLVDSVKSTQPSLPAVEKEKYKRIYARFARNDNFTEDMLKNQKATLA